MTKNYGIIDQRTNPKGKSLPNRQRFVKREKDAIKEAVAERIRNGKIEDLAAGGGQRVKLHSKRTEEPTFHHGPGGTTERVYPGNKEFQKGDRIPRPEGGGGGKEGSPDGEGEDDFYFELSFDEWRDALFDGMEIPNQIKKSLTGEDEFEWRRSGFKSDGAPNQMDIQRTTQRALARRHAFSTPYLRRKAELEKELKELREIVANAGGKDVSREEARIAEIQNELVVVERKLKSVPFLDTFDLKFRRHELFPIPVTKAVMFAMLDVSGSMGEWEKEMAKRFFILLYIFLTRIYERVEIVWLRHTTEAKEVTQEEFFTSRESGGTIVSSALELMKTIIAERYRIEEWNIYGCHASDGDNFSHDNDNVLSLMDDFILPVSQYYAYIEVRQPRTGNGELWPLYEQLLAGHENLAINHIRSKDDIYPVFRKLFERKETKHG
ncbi:MAG: YeaH/YhbH family protein [bacterium]|nr:YeaH/YhbH family protein [bacterium]